MVEMRTAVVKCSCGKDFTVSSMVVSKTFLGLKYGEGIGFDLQAFPEEHKVHTVKGWVWQGQENGLDTKEMWILLTGFLGGTLFGVIVMALLA